MFPRPHFREEQVMATDEAFGTIRWNTSRKCWETTASLPFFRGAGQRLELTAEERAELVQADRLPMTVQTGDKRREPNERQRTVWQSMKKRGDALWEEALDALIVEYQRQWPLRARYYRQVCADKRLREQVLPERVDREAMRQMIVPVSCTLEWPDSNHGTTDFSLTLIVTWFVDPLNVYVRDARVTEVVPMGWFMNRRNPRTENPVFGTIRRRPNSGMPWVGEVEIEPFTKWAALAVDRQHWDESYDRRDERSSLPFHVPRGSAGVLIHGSPNQPPTARQEAAFAEAKTVAVTGEVIRELFAHYQEIAAERRKGYKGSGRNAAIPPLKSPTGLREITELKWMSVFPEEESQPIAIGFEFHGSWTGCAGLAGFDGCGVRWRGGKVERVGDPRVANPDRYLRFETRGRSVIHARPGKQSRS
jgi:hypothetical protein